jgi:hypothetical protein
MANHIGQLTDKLICDYNMPKKNAHSVLKKMCILAHTDATMEVHIALAQHLDV